MAVLVSTPGAANANSYATAAEWDAYNETRYPQFAITSDDVKEALLIQATRTLDLSLSGIRRSIKINGEPSYFVVGQKWSGAPTTTTQALAWPRTGMYDRNGNAIASNVIPQDLKNAICELAGQMYSGDKFKDNSVAVQGLRSFSAGPVSFSWKDSIETTKVIPDFVWALLVPSWVLDEETTGWDTPMFEVL